MQLMVGITEGSDVSKEKKPFLAVLGAGRGQAFQRSVGEIAAMG